MRDTPISRREFVIGSAALFTVTRNTARLAQKRGPLEEIEARRGGRLGVFAFDPLSGRSVGYRADERFLMCSTFKALLAAQIFSRVDAGLESLDRMIAYGRSDLVFTSPVTEANVDKGEMSVGELCRAILEMSDNTAAVLLMRSVGGPAALTGFARGLGDTVTRSDRYEPESNIPSADLDTTTPRMMATNVQRLLLGDTLSTASRQRLLDGMIACKPGLHRIRAALPPEWRSGDRPGTNTDNETNDVAVAYPVGRSAPLFVSAYYDAPKLRPDGREAVLREVGTVFVSWAKGRR